MRTGPRWRRPTGRRPASPTGSNCGWARRWARCAPCPPQAAFDLAFIDADKTGYAGYWDEIVPRIRSGGINLVVNTLLHPRIFAPAPDDADARAIRDFNTHVLADDRVELAMLSIGDGLIFARKK